MKQVWHLFRYDVKRSWPLLAGWGIFLLVTFARELRDPLERIDAKISPLEWLHWESTVAWLAVAAGTGMLFVSDSPVGNRAFWKTRPIERWAILASKLLYAVVFFSLIPLVLNCIWAWRFGMGPLEWISMGAQQAMMGAALFLPLAALASLVRTFVMYLVAAFAAWIATLAILISAMSFGDPSGGVAWPFDRGPESAIAQALPLAVAIVAALAVLATQYLRQNRSLAIAAAVCGCLLGTASIRWAKPLAAALAPKNIRQSEFGLSAEILPAIHVNEGFWGYQQSSRVRIPTRFSVEGLEPNQILYDIQLNAGLGFPGSKDVDVSRNLGSKIAYSKPGLAGLKSFPLHSSSTTNLNLYDEPYPAPADRTGILRGTIEARVGRIRLLGSMPLEPGASIDAGARRIVLEAGELTKTLVTASVLSRLMGKPPGTAPQAMLLLVNQERAEHLTAPVAVLGSNSLRSFHVFLFGEPMLLTQRNEMKFGLRYPSDEGIVSATPTWLEDAELQVFSVEPVEQVKIPLEVEEFRLRMYRR